MHKGLFIADVHIGAVSIEETEEQLKSYEEILESMQPDFVVIGGDLFDKQLYENDPYIEYAWKFLEITIKHTEKIRIVYGTSSHEAMQYKLFESILKEQPIDLEVVYTVSEEQLYEDVKVLYIPEEYIYDKTEYYKEFLSKEKEYQFVFGHGMIYEAFKGKIDKPSNTPSKRRKAPVFSTGELSHCCNGQVLFGHYHVHTEFEGDVSYVGSFYRWIQGEEEAKGCYLISYENGQATKQFLVNTKAKLYITKIYGYEDSIFSDTKELEEDCQRLLDLQEKDKIEKFRIIYNIPLGYENAERLIKYVRERFRSNKHMQVEFKNGYVAEEKKIAEAPIDEEAELYQFVTDPNIPEEDMLSQFLLKKKGETLDAVTIKKYLDELE